MEHHNIFSLEPNEVGCTDTAEHVIDLLDTKPFKERFRHIAPPVVEEVREHIQEMLGVLSAYPSPHGVMRWFWSARRIGASGSASVFAD